MAIDNSSVVAVVSRNESVGLSICRTEEGIARKTAVNRSGRMAQIWPIGLRLKRVDHLSRTCKASIFEQMVVQYAGSGVIHNLNVLSFLCPSPLHNKSNLFKYLRTFTHRNTHTHTRVVCVTGQTVKRARAYTRTCVCVFMSVCAPGACVAGCGQLLQICIETIDVRHTHNHSNSEFASGHHHMAYPILFNICS